MYEETHRPYSSSRRARNMISILAHNQAGRHWVYSGHYPRIFVAPKNAQNAETKHRSRAVPILLLALSALMTSAYTSLGFSQELNPRPQLLKALVYHSATSAVLSVGIKVITRAGAITAAAKAVSTSCENVKRHKSAARTRNCRKTQSKEQRGEIRQTNRTGHAEGRACLSEEQ
jgi:hypothetical protein